MSYGEWLEFYLLHTRSVVLEHEIRVLVELVRDQRSGYGSRNSLFFFFVEEVKKLCSGIFSNMVEASMLSGYR